MSLSGKGLQEFSGGQYRVSSDPGGTILTSYSSDTKC